MRLLAMLLLGCLAQPLAQAQRIPAPKIPATGQKVADFVPPHYALLADGQASYDFNRDGRPDKVLVLRPLLEDQPDRIDPDMPGRILLILLGTPTGYTLDAQSSRIMLCRGCGGVYGDPFAGLDVKNGILTISHYGGSSWRWSITSKFRYQQGSFYLIGETTDYGRVEGDCEGLDGPAGRNYRDTNFVTGDYEIEKISDDCKLLLHKRGKTKPTPLRKLIDYASVP
jgi:hypothetical protein